MAPNNSTEKENLIVDFPQRPRRNSYHNGSRQNQAVTPFEHIRNEESRQHPRKHANRVRFAEISTVHRGRYTADGGDGTPLSSTWYVKSDYKSFKSTVKSDVQLMRLVTTGRIEQEPNQEYIFTGIEHLSSRSMVRRTVESQIAHKDAVLNEFKRQETLQLVDLKSLRNASKAHSKWGKVKALILAGNTQCDRTEDDASQN